MPAFAPVSTLPVAAVPPRIWVTGSLPTFVKIGSVLSVGFMVIGGVAPYTWSASGLPTGLSINASTGVVSGTAATIGTYSWSVTATDSTSPTPLTSSTSGSTNVIAVPNYNYDFPNPRGKSWPPDIRTGWIWQSQTALQIPAGAFMNSSKFIAYAVIIPQPYYVQRIWELPPPRPPREWIFIRRWESGPPLPLQTTPYHPFGAQEFPAKLYSKKSNLDWINISTINNLTVSPIGLQNFPDRLYFKKSGLDWSQVTPIWTIIQDTGFIYLIFD